MEMNIMNSRFSEALCGSSFLPRGLSKAGVERSMKFRGQCADGVRGRMDEESSLPILIRRNFILWRLNVWNLHELTLGGVECVRNKDTTSTRKRTFRIQSKSSAPEMVTFKRFEDPYSTNDYTSRGIEESKDLRALLVHLRNGGPGGDQIVFPPAMSGKERRRAHEIAERLGLEHVSVGQGKQRCFTARRMTVGERLTKFRQLLEKEEAACRENLAFDQPLQSWKILEAQGILLHKAFVVEKEIASFGRERWVLEDGIGAERKGHVSRFAQRARPGMAIRIADKDPVGSWVVSEGQPPGRVAWSRGGKICLVFDYPPASNDETREICVLRVPDSTSFDRMRSVLGVCERAEKGMSILLNALLADGVLCASVSSPSSIQERLDESTSSRAQENWEKVALKEEQFDEGLNAEQRAAVRLCIEDSRSPVVLIHGPFGTGKTRTLVEIVRQQMKSGKRVLVCAASNAAVDNMALALLTADSSIPLARAGVTDRVASAVAAYTVESLQDAQPEAAIARKLRKEAYAMQLTAEKWTRASDGGKRRRNARKEVNALFKDARRLDQVCASSVLCRTKVLCGTLTGFASCLHDLGDTEGTQFDCVIIDEASQAITPALLLVLPYLKYRDNLVNEASSPLVVMAGDHQQLPPTVLSDDDDDKRGGLEATLFEELMERDGGGLGTRLEELVAGADLWDRAKLSIISKAHAIAADEEETAELAVARLHGGYISGALRQQYRMPAQLMAFPSAAFYGAQLIARHQAPDRSNEHTDSMVSILDSGLLLEVIDTAGGGFEEEKNGESSPASARSTMGIENYSISNPGQAKLTARVVKELLQLNTYSAGDIGVVTPYSAQVMLLRQLMAEESRSGLEIDSVDAFQGREKDVIILDTVRSNMEGTVGFLSDFHRLNVGITRARQKLIVIGDSATLSSDKIWALFFEWVSEYRERPETRIRYSSIFELPEEAGW